MKRRVIHIDQDKCNGCGACASACHEGAIGMVNGKARLMRDDYCDGLGDCLPACPTNAITFVEREAAPYDEAAVQANKAALKAGKAVDTAFAPTVSRLQQWPVQIKLAPVNAPYFNGAQLLIAADCTAYAYAGFHEKFMKGHVTLIGCPKLDAIDYSEKLTEIFRNNDIRSISVVRMEVPCCGGMTYAVQRAIANSGKDIPCKVTVLSINGDILNE
jgi:NAD-dependent dihydropyrimidine dehydrogenase PreA subunit